MAERDRMTLGDLYAHRGPFLGPRTTFVTAYPTIYELSIEINETGKRLYGAGHSRILDKTTVSEAIRELPWRKSWRFRMMGRILVARECKSWQKWSRSGSGTRRT